MDQPKTPDTTKIPIERRRETRLTFTSLVKIFGIVTTLAGFVIWSHVGSGVAVFHAHTPNESGWEQFRSTYGVNKSGDDSHFSRAAQNGYNLFFYTHKYAARFTGKHADNANNACASCHSVEDLAYSFVSADRFDPKLGKRVSFEERVMRCYVGPMEGFVPTIYDPAVQDIRILARAVARHLRLSEGALKHGG